MDRPPPAGLSHRRTSTHTRNPPARPTTRTRHPARPVHRPGAIPGRAQPPAHGTQRPIRPQDVTPRRASPHWQTTRAQHHYLPANHPLGVASAVKTHAGVPTSPLIGLNGRQGPRTTTSSQPNGLGRASSQQRTAHSIHRPVAGRRQQTGQPRPRAQPSSTRAAASTPTQRPPRSPGTTTCATTALRRTEPGQAEQDRAEPGLAWPGQAELKLDRAEPDRGEPDQTGPGPAGPGRTGQNSGRAEPDRPSRAGPRPDRTQAEQDHAEQSRAGPG